ncbi:FIST signal transduction protein [Candidatus Formimonas warabiya]|uniref:FIST domain-containing protein n=1 Tax=Formimonas warabiya TaxID=1761012 RepID=A0A3G1KQ51_FORW1|nr:FIST N-terminal domain-containing protein [Candidatus Formimonas warabiya]ATW24560.1 hypothetical protein DCMF_06975 [Candidatus Formimonas warabiya]
MKNISTAYSTQKDISAAVNEIKSQIEIERPKAVIFFASSCFPEQISRAMQDAFQESVVFGCSTAGELVNDQMLKGSVVAMAFSPAVFEDIHVEILSRIDQEDPVDQAMNNFERHFKIPVLEMDIAKYFGFVLFDGLSNAEERIMASIGSKSNIVFVGGSAGDDVQFKRTWVYAQGQAYHNAAILALVKSGVEFSIIKTQSFQVTDQLLTATKVNESAREVIEFNGRPAAQEYARVLGVDAGSLADKFMSNPLGLVIDEEPFVRSPQQIIDDRIRFYCQILEGMELAVLAGTSIGADTRKSIHELKTSLGTISGLINFHCILRTLELEAKKQQSEYGAIFKDIPTVGLSTYGEAYLGHINQTSTIIAFK